MCGIVGFLNKKECEKDIIIKKMADKIIHRGPDQEGYYVDDYIALGHRRLSIIDITSGNQPIFNEDRSLVLIFNGEIYNYIKLKEILKKKGHIFKTNSDTEVLLHGYEEWGENLPQKLRGMFAFAIWDIQRHTLFCARDHFGIKPFYYYKANDIFMFSSEIKSFLEHPDFKKVLNKKLLGPYLSFSFTPTNETFFENVYSLAPGTSLTIKGNFMKIKTFYDIDFNEKQISMDKAVKNISKTIKDSINHHKISDVEIATFLSSGVDSSYIASVLKPNKTYTIRI